MGIKEDKRTQMEIAEGRSPRGHRMPETREQYELMADVFEKALLREKEINSKLRADNANLRNKLTRRSS